MLVLLNMNIKITVKFGISYYNYKKWELTVNNQAEFKNLNNCLVYFIYT